MRYWIFKANNNIDIQALIADSKIFANIHFSTQTQHEKTF